MTILNLHFDETNLRIALRHSETARAILDAIPFQATIRTWGQKVIFDCPVRVPYENNATHIVKPGDIGFWPDGSSIAITYGTTPMSRDGESRLAFNCNIWADALDDVTELKNLESGAQVTVDIWYANNLKQVS